MTFQQSRPEGAEWALTTQHGKWAGQLTYKNQSTGAEITCPNIWYNQPVEWQIKWALTEAESREQIAKRHDQSTDKWGPDQARLNRNIAAELLDLAARMKAEGRPLRNSPGKQQ